MVWKVSANVLPLTVRVDVRRDWPKSTRINQPKLCRGMRNCGINHYIYCLSIVEIGKRHNNRKREKYSWVLRWQVNDFVIRASAPSSIHRPVANLLLEEECLQGVHFFLQGGYLSDGGRMNSIRTNFFNYLEICKSTEPCCSGCEIVQGDPSRWWKPPIDLYLGCSVFLPWSYA